MEFNDDSGEWLIPAYQEFLQHTKKVDKSNKLLEEPKQNLAMGFNDDEELFSNNDIQLSMILDMNTHPKSVYLSYDEQKKPKKGVKLTKKIK